ncbi:MAG: HD domain-containing protein [bacterium]|nr:HD domain-containing protein [bacterium]MDT8396401.1 HD domain-containing protein [bacterium]
MTALNHKRKGKAGKDTRAGMPRVEKPEKTGPKIRILYQFLLVTLAVAVLPLLMASYKLMGINRAFLEDELLALHSQVANAAAEEISTAMSNILVNLELVAKAQGGGSPLGKEERERSLIFYLDQYPEIIRLTQYSTGGRQLARVFRVGKSKVPPLAEEVMTTAVKEASAGKTYISPPVVLGGQQVPEIVVGMPVYGPSGGIQSVLLGEINLQKVQQTVERINIRRQGNAYVVDRKGTLIAHQDLERVANSEDMTSVEIVGNYLLAGLSAGTIPFRDKMGKDMVGSYANVKALGWGVVVQEPRADAYQIIRDMTVQTGIWAVVAFVLAGIASTLLAIRLAKPIGILAGKAMSLSRGNFAERVDITSRNELGQLAQSFNHMAAQLERHDQNLREMFIDTTKALAAAIDAKDPYTRGHSQRVAQISLEIAKEMGVSPTDQQKVNIAALLHDVGKIGIEDQVLKKPGQLTDEEYAVIKQHPRWGAMIMGHITQLKDIVPGIQYHHERLDGSGYPEGRAGEQIPLLARIIAVADTFDAMTTDRLYQKGMEPQFVVSKLHEWKGSRYDPKVVDAMTRVYSRVVTARPPAPQPPTPPQSTPGA